MDGTLFPKGFFDIGLKSYLWVFENKKEFVDFTITGMKNCKGIYKSWQDYVLEKSNINKSDDQIVNNRSEKGWRKISQNEIKQFSSKC